MMERNFMASLEMIARISLIFMLGMALGDKIIARSPRPICISVAIYVEEIWYLDYKDTISAAVFNLKKTFSMHGIMVFVQNFEKLTIAKDQDRQINSLLKYFVSHVNSVTSNEDVNLLLGLYPGSVSGLGTYKTICTKDAAAVINIKNMDPVVIANVMAHEIGHILGMMHLGRLRNICGYDEFPCIMNATVDVNEQSLGIFDASSLDSWEHKLGDCTSDCQLGMDDKFPCCGNGVIETYSGESCDCGDEKMCSYIDPFGCCDQTTCRLKHGSYQCSTELCCEQCILQDGRICRKAENECDVTDVCAESQQFCPEDVFKVNGFPCENKGYCYDGMCHSRDQMCYNMFPGTTAFLSEKCMRIMNIVKHDYCSDPKTHENVKEVLCGNNTRVCNRIFCEIKEYINYGVVIRIGGLRCHTLPKMAGLAENGLPCGDGKFCVNRQCVPVVIPEFCSSCLDGEVCLSNNTCHKQGS